MAMCFSVCLQDDGSKSQANAAGLTVIGDNWAQGRRDCNMAHSFAYGHAPYSSCFSDQNSGFFNTYSIFIYTVNMCVILFLSN